ncbi:MAG: S1 RNA-binding domain-containing protein, partial [Patescibacteria group bacterium]
ASGTEGLVHVSEIAPFRVEKVSDILKEGDRVPVKIIKVDEKGRLNLSIKEADANFFKPKS